MRTDEICGHDGIDEASNTSTRCNYANGEAFLSLEPGRDDCGETC